MPMTNEQDQPAIVSNAVSSEVERSDTEGDLELEPGDAEDVVGGYCVGGKHITTGQITT